MLAREITARTEPPASVASHSGRSPLDVVVAQSVRAEVALRDEAPGDVVVTGLWDLLEAYEHVDHSRVDTETSLPLAFHSPSSVLP